MLRKVGSGSIPRRECGRDSGYHWRSCSKSEVARLEAELAEAKELAEKQGARAERFIEVIRHRDSEVVRLENELGVAVDQRDTARRELEEARAEIERLLGEEERDG